MKYLELDFIISPYSRDAADILMALVADAGLESFVDTPKDMCTPDFSSVPYWIA